MSAMLDPFVADLERFPREAVTLADRASDPDVGKKIHFEAVGGRAPRTPRSGPPETLKLKRPGLKPRIFDSGNWGEQVADQVKQLDVRGGFERGVRPMG
jgi:hypothetical protein